MFKKENLNLILLILITIVGSVVRLYKFPDFPEFTDEVREALVAYKLYSFEEFPLTSFSKYIGPIHTYFMALTMWLFGPNIWLPRFISLIFNILLIPLSYILGKEYFNKKVGLLTSLSVALNPTLILINSRVGWATCVSPFFGILLLITLKKFEKTPSIKLSVAIGLLFAVLLNLHPLMLFFIFPLIIYYIYQLFKLPEIKTRIKLSAITLISGVIIMLPLIIANIQNPFISLTGALEQENISEKKLDTNFSEYFVDLDRMIAQIEHLINRSVIFDGHLVPKYEYRPIYDIRSFFDLPFIIFLIGALFIFIKKNYKLLLILGIILCVIILSPFFTSNYFEGLTVRYFSAIIPLFDFIAAYGLYQLTKLTKNSVVKSFVIFVGFMVVVYVPYQNLTQFFSQDYGDIQMDINKDIEYLQNIKNQNYQVSYIESSARDFNTEYSTAEYLIKFIGIKNLNPIRETYIPSNNRVLIIPSEADKENKEPLIKVIEDNNLEKVYKGSKFMVYQ